MSIRGFMEVPRRDRKYQSVKKRLNHYDEFSVSVSEKTIQKQAYRCMQCGIPYCMGDSENKSGCPVQNQIPDWNELVENKQWKRALENLHSTNNFPEFTGKICPAPCEQSCTLKFTQDSPVTIKSIELAIIEKGWKEGWVQVEWPKHVTEKRIAIIGSGPAGLACAQQLRRAGHNVAVFEREEKAGGLMRYGVPDFKLRKNDIDRRLAQIMGEGIDIWTNREVGVDYAVDIMLEKYDAVVLATGSEMPRDLPVDGADLQGVYYAMDYLRQMNKWVGGKEPEPLNVKDKKVVVIGGGDTASDVIGNANRQGAASMLNFTHGPKPPDRADKMEAWPYWPLEVMTTTSHEEGCNRRWAMGVKSFEGENGVLTGINCVHMKNRMPIPNTDFFVPADFVFIATGFISPKQKLLNEFGVKYENGKIITNNYQTSMNKVFAAGDARMGASLIVWAIREGRRCAVAVDEYLMGKSELPL